MFQTIDLKKNPEIKAVIQSADSSYKKHKAFLQVRERVSLSNTYWDGGSRSTYHAVRLDNKASLGAPQYAPSAFGGSSHVKVVEIPEGVVIVETGYFQGKTATASVYVSPSNVAKLLTTTA